MRDVGEIGRTRRREKDGVLERKPEKVSKREPEESKVGGGVSLGKRTRERQTGREGEEW